MKDERDFWDLGEAPKRAPGKVFAKDTDTVEMPIGGECAAEEIIPKPDEEKRKRLEAARAVMNETQTRSRAAKETRPTGTASRLLREEPEDEFDLPVTQKEKRSDAVAFLQKMRDDLAKQGDPFSPPPAPPKPPVPPRPRVQTAPVKEEAIPPMPSAAPAIEYVPENPLLRSVRLLPWQRRYIFFDSFLRAAKRLHSVRGVKAPAVPLFDLMPHYDKLTAAQKTFYLWFREEARAGRFLEADSAYALLYIYEILNLPDLIPPEEGVRLLCALLAHYRQKNRRIEHSLTEWICDYCLIHRVSPDYPVLAPFYADLIRASSCPSFWLGEDRGYPSLLAASVRFASYDYTQSPFRTAENAAFFDRHMKGALDAALSAAAPLGDEALKQFGLGSRNAQPLARDAYAGAVCAFENKYRIEVDAIPLLRSFEFLTMINELLKYTENRVRSLLGIRSRYHTHPASEGGALAQQLRAGVDAYFAPLDAKRKEEKKPAPAAAPVPEYERYYEPTSTGLDTAQAAKIEAEAWKTTRLLTEDEEEENEEEAMKGPPPASAEASEAAEEAKEAQNEENAGVPASDPVREGFAALLKEDSAGFAAAAARAQLLPDTLAERCNDLAFDLLGDTAVEYNGSTYVILSDYREDIAEWMKTRSRNES